MNQLVLCSPHNTLNFVIHISFLKIYFCQFQTYSLHFKLRWGKHILEVTFSYFRLETETSLHYQVRPNTRTVDSHASSGPDSLTSNIFISSFIREIIILIEEKIGHDNFPFSQRIFVLAPRA